MLPIDGFHRCPNRAGKIRVGESCRYSVAMEVNYRDKTPTSLLTVSLCVHLIVREPLIKRRHGTRRNITDRTSAFSISVSGAIKDFIARNANTVLPVTACVVTVYRVSLIDMVSLFDFQDYDAIAEWLWRGGEIKEEKSRKRLVWRKLKPPVCSTGVFQLRPTSCRRVLTTVRKQLRE